jgi:outer membrane protein assembly factor BamB
MHTPVVAAPDSAHMALFSALVGTWAGTVEHGGESQTIAFGLAPGHGDQMEVYLSFPVAHLDRVPFGSGRPVADGDSVRVGTFRFAMDRARGEITGLLPAGLVPYYRIPFRLKRVDRFDVPPRDPLTIEEPSPSWTYDAGSAIWAGPAYADGTVFIGALNGEVTALDAHTGARMWKFHAWGAVRARPTLFKGVVYVQADDGYLYAIDAEKGHLRWKTQIDESAIQRLPFDDPKTLFDRFSADVVVDHDRLFVGTHDGRVLSLSAKDGKQIWTFDADGPVLAAPAVDRGMVVFGSYNHFVYAVDEKEGQLIWKTDTHGAVVSTPAMFDERAIVGNRIYDLLGLDLRNGHVAWKSYEWMSWVESSAAAGDEIAYVGSSDATSVYAFENETGKRLWTSDVRGWSWGQPAVDRQRIFVGTSSQVGYPGLEAGAMALDRETGNPVWRFPASKPDSGDYGFAGSAAVGPDLVYFADLNGTVYAFEP